jgi:hypothetical protein
MRMERMEVLVAAPKRQLLPVSVVEVATAAAALDDAVKSCRRPTAVWGKPQRVVATEVVPDLKGATRMADDRRAAAEEVRLWGVDESLLVPRPLPERSLAFGKRRVVVARRILCCVYDFED